MGKSNTARKPAIAPRPAPAPAAAPKHAPVEVGAFETEPLVNLEEEGPMHAPMHGDMHSDGPESEQHFEGEIHSDNWEKNWAPPEQLAAPEAREGMTQRWIRSSLLGKPDAKNTALQGGQGWRPRALNSVPEGERKHYPTSKDVKTAAEFMVSGDLVLCEMPTSRFNQMKAHYQSKARGQTDALIDANLANAAVPGASRHGMHAPRVVERETKVSTRRPIVAAD